MVDFVVILASSLTRDRQKCQDRPVIFCNPYRFFISIDNFRKKCNNGCIEYAVLPMVINSQLAPSQQSFRITLDLTVDQDFNPRQIDYQRLFDLSEWESINTHIEEY